jgi:hypothetical protein
VQKFFNELINSAREKIQILFSSTNLFYHYFPYYKKESQGGFQIGEKANKGIVVKIIIPTEKMTSGRCSKSDIQESLDIRIRNIEEIDFLDNTIILLVVDGKRSLAINLKEKKENKDKATVSGHSTTSIPDDSVQEPTYRQCYFTRRYLKPFGRNWRSMRRSRIFLRNQDPKRARKQIFSA